MFQYVLTYKNPLQIDHKLSHTNAHHIFILKNESFKIWYGSLFGGILYYENGEKKFFCCFRYWVGTYNGSFFLFTTLKL